MHFYQSSIQYFIKISAWSGLSYKYGKRAVATQIRLCHLEDLSVFSLQPVLSIQGEKTEDPDHYIYVHKLSSPKNASLYSKTWCYRKGVLTTCHAVLSAVFGRPVLSKERGYGKTHIRLPHVAVQAPFSLQPVLLIQREVWE